MQKPYKIAETWYSRLLPGADILAPRSVLGKYKIFQSSLSPLLPYTISLLPCHLFLYLCSFFFFFFIANPPYNISSACNIFLPPLVSHACIILQFINQWIFIHILWLVSPATFDFSTPVAIKCINIVTRGVNLDVL